MKKIICMIFGIVIVLNMCSLSFAATNLKDIKGTKYEDAVTNLVEVGLVNGYEDSTYRPNVAVTRAQMAKMLVIALGEEGKVANAAKQANSFKDMTSSHWAYGYVNVAKSIGIINGYTDGTFSPDATVSYAEATTMAVRALGYDEEVARSSESWPNNYIAKAKDLKMFNNIGSFVNNNGAARGDVAILLWNMLNTGVATVTSQNSNGLVYGEGEKMIAKYSGYSSITDGVITDLKFDDSFENATVTVTDAHGNLKLTMSDTDVLKYFGKSLNILYNTKNKKIMSIESAKKYKEITGDIERFTSKKITIDDDSYDLPDKKSIFLYNAEDSSEAIEATLYLENSTVKYVLAKGASNVDFGLVTDTNITINSKKDGIKVKKVGSTKVESYVLIDTDDMPAKYSIIAYYLNGDKELGIAKEIKQDDAKSIASHSSTKIKIGKETYTYDSDKFVVYSATTSNLKTLAFKSIDEETDLVYLYEHSGKTYLIIFEDAVENEDTRKELYSDLKNLIKEVEDYEEDEDEYTQSTFAEFLKALEAAKAIKSTDKSTKISTAFSDLKSAYQGLKEVSASSTEGKIASKRASLRKLVNGKAADIVKNKALYTTDSYSKFNTYLTIANRVLADTSSTLSEATDAYDDLNGSISKDLVLITGTTEYKNALAALNAAIDSAKSVGAKENYTTSSYNAFNTAYTAANNAKTNAASKTATELNTAANNLKNAIAGLQAAIDTVKEELNELIVKCIDYVDNKDDYMPATYSAFKKVYDEARTAVNGTDMAAMKKSLADLKTARNNLKLVDTALNEVVKAVDGMKNAPSVKEALATPVKDSEDKIKKIDIIKEAVKQDLEDLIEAANKIATEQGASGDGSIFIAIGNAKNALNSSSSTINTLVKCYTSLNALVK